MELKDTAITVSYAKSQRKVLIQVPIHQLMIIALLHLKSVNNQGFKLA